MEKPLCEGTHPDLFFDDRYTDVAKALCGKCQFRLNCLAEGIQEAAYGVWGGATESERVDMTNSTIEINWTG